MPYNPSSAENLKPFQPGQSGNPDGLPKGTRHLSTLLKEALTKGVTVEVAGKSVSVNEAELIKQVAIGIANGNIKFIEMAFDRIDGKASQPLELSGPNGGPIERKVNYDELTDEELDQIIARGRTSPQ